jgi:uncharacterized protein YggT (Ycf19 family)
MLQFLWHVPLLLYVGWIDTMADPNSLRSVTRILNRISEPYLYRVRGLLPTVGMLDLSPFLIFILAWIVRQLLVMLMY